MTAVRHDGVHVLLRNGYDVRLCRGCWCGRGGAICVCVQVGGAVVAGVIPIAGGVPRGVSSSVSVTGCVRCPLCAGCGIGNSCVLACESTIWIVTVGLSLPNASAATEINIIRINFFIFRDSSPIVIFYHSFGDVLGNRGVCPPGERGLGAAGCVVYLRSLSLFRPAKLWVRPKRAED